MPALTASKRPSFPFFLSSAGNSPSSLPSALSADIEICGITANSTGIPCLVLWDIPSQPIIFTADPARKARSEDSAVAFTWSLFLQEAAAGGNPDPTQLLHWPMTRAASVCMDAGESFLATKGFTINRWMAMGASKRGWTTWLLGAVEKDRLIGITPVVFDLLDMPTGFNRMQQALGNATTPEWSFVMSDYVDQGIPTYIGTPGFALLSSYMDPLNYAVNLSMPKLVVNAAGDEFFNLWDDHTWWGQLPGESLRFIVTAAEHSMITGLVRVLNTVKAWLWALLTNTPRPTPSWQLNTDTDGSIVLNVAAQPGTPQVSQVKLQTVNTLQPLRKDFRLITGNTPADPCKYIPVPVFGGGCLVPMLWTPTDIALNSSNTIITLKQDAPATGWRAFMASLFYPGPAGTNTTYELTTQASVIPNTWPAPPCSGQKCDGGFV
jgi:PhoPQ-activated pathogenicity-related protein